MSNDREYILVLNAGSSSLKFAVFDSTSLKEIHRGEIEATGARALNDALEAIKDHASVERIRAIGHRVVHGGSAYREPTRIDQTLLEALRGLVPISPQHLPLQIESIELTLSSYPNVTQYACFDTAFFKDLPEIAYTFALPKSYRDQGIRRYGFHGLSYEYILKSLNESLDEPTKAKRIIVAHLGSGASLVAIENGAPVDTTMGLTPASGIPMATRSGDLDPGILAYLAKAPGFTPETFSHMINFESGLLGLSGSTGDMKTLIERSATDPHAAEAINVFCYHVKKSIGALCAAMGGIDILVFTGGIGEASALIRHQTLEGMEYLGLRLDTEANAVNSTRISTTDSRAIIYMIPTDEASMIAHHVQTTLHT